MIRSIGVFLAFLVLYVPMQWVMNAPVSGDFLFGVACGCFAMREPWKSKVSKT